MFEGLFQLMHLLVIFGIALLVFGPKKLPELGKGIGEGIRGFKSAMRPRKRSQPPPSLQLLIVQSWLRSNSWDLAQKFFFCWCWGCWFWARSGCTHWWDRSCGLRRSLKRLAVASSLSCRRNSPRDVRTASLMHPTNQLSTIEDPRSRTYSARALTNAFQLWNGMPGGLG